MSAPLIGVTLDSEPAGGWSRYPWYALRANYAEALAAAGALPVALPHLPAIAEAMLDRMAGLVVTGGAFDVDPALYGAAERHGTVTLKQARTEAELALLRGALQRKLPVLGICGGQQLLAVALGGTLVQHIPNALTDSLEHEQKKPRHQTSHDVAIAPDTLLHRIAGTTTAAVNSAHHQAVRDAGRGKINATAPDGVIEGIELADAKFVLGVQWHPEFCITQTDRAIFDAFVAACR